MLVSADCDKTKKRKACKDCTCGLAEELDAGKPVKPKPITSSCGSVSLGMDVKQDMIYVYLG